MGRKRGSGPYRFQRGNPWRDASGKFCSRSQDLDGSPHSHPIRLYAPYPDGSEREQELEQRHKR
ncbi:MAG: hypothetical protein QY317_16615 [Candidatus Jettenia caeni]|nr:MAG: hypothetical protein QY317_16615 [Candidatus Jettenia caeni]